MRCSSLVGSARGRTGAMGGARRGGRGVLKEERPNFCRKVGERVGIHGFSSSMSSKTRQKFGTGIGVALADWYLNQFEAWTAIFCKALLEVADDLIGGDGVSLH